MKPNAIAAVGIAFVDLPLPVEPYPLFRQSSAKMEGGAGTALACFAVAQINPIRFTRGYHSQRVTVALPGSFHRHPPRSCSRSLADLVGSRRALQIERFSIAPPLSGSFA